MQNLTYFRTGTTRLYRVINSNNLLTFNRCLATTNKSENDLGINTEIYKPSTTKQATPVPSDLHSGQPIETFDTAPKIMPTLTGGGKVWSQNPESIHIAPLGAARTTVIPSTSGDNKLVHETTVHTTQGEVNFVDPLKTHALQGEATPGQLAEAAAASAFQQFPPDTPLDTPSSTNPLLAPNISSTDIYSTSVSPTAQFANVVGATSQDTNKFQATTDSKVFGGQDTTASTKKHPTDDPFKSTTSTSTSGTSTEIPIQRESDIRNNILREALKYVQEKGWTMDAIRAGIRANNQPSTVEGLFSTGYDLVEYFMHDANMKMAAYMKEKSKEGLQGGRLLVDGMKYRLSLVIPYANTWDQALAQGALPQNAARGWKNLLDLAGDAWEGVGDTSTDMNWYTKRLLLAAVYKSTEIYMLQDQSLDKIDTMNFLERRLNDFQTLGSVRNSVSKSLSDTANLVNGLFSVVRNLTSRR